MTSTNAILAVAALVIFGWVGVWRWTICRIYVEPGEMMVLAARVGRSNPDPENQRVVDRGFQGVEKVVLGEGRHFVNPLYYDRSTAQVVTVGSDEVAVVESRTGKPLPEGQFLVDLNLEDLDGRGALYGERPAPGAPGEAAGTATGIYASKGIWRPVLTPGRWRLNPVAFKVTKAKAIRIAPGYVGCVTSLSGKDPEAGELAGRGERGIQKHVLQSGIYYYNPAAYKVDRIEIGYRELSHDNVSFPSRDGFPIQVDVTVVWGLEPSSVPTVMMHLGNVEQVVDKILQPQIESICRIEGSRYGAKELIEGDSREMFQRSFTDMLTRVCKDKAIKVIICLVRSIDVPMEIRQPIQQARVAQEERRTKEEQRITQGSQNQLADIQADVEKGVREVGAETEKLVAHVRADGEKKVAEIQAQQMVDVAAIEKKIAELAAERTRLLGKAEATVTQLVNEAEADRLKQSVDAIGGASAYSGYQFATHLPEDFRVFIRYAGPGTFWTDLPAGARSLKDAADMKILEEPAARPGAAAAPAGTARGAGGAKAESTGATGDGEPAGGSTAGP
jgi:regulator of protease activity HflC (stomatin/prohibitin superfamily)